MLRDRWYSPPFQISTALAQTFSIGHWLPRSDYDGMFVGMRSVCGANSTTRPGILGQLLDALAAWLPRLLEMTPDQLPRMVSDHNRRSRRWPKGSNALRRIATNTREAGMELEFGDPYHDHR
jgi:hypothetical protein